MLSKNSIAIVRVMTGCVVCINHMCIIWKTDIGCTFKYSNAASVRTWRKCDSSLKIALAALLVPASTGYCGRGFSALKRIKSPLSNPLSNAITNN